MKIRTIEKLLKKKFDEFVDSIQDTHVKSLVKKNSIITGGSIASMFLKEKTNDYDIYFTNKETVLAVTRYYVNLFNIKNDTDIEVIDGDEVPEWKNFSDDYKAGREILFQPGRVRIFASSAEICKEKGLQEEEIHELGDTIEIKDDKGEKYRPVYLSSNAITLSSQIQIIIRFYGEANEIHDNYDFAHCTNYWLSKDEKLYANQKALECLLAKELYYIGSKYPLASIIRIRKFIQRGWQINAGQILKMCYQVSQLDLNDLQTLEDQLVGVDLAYFSTLIDALKNVSGKEKINYNYLSTIIDKIF